MGAVTERPIRRSLQWDDGTPVFRRAGQYPFQRPGVAISSRWSSGSRK